MNKRQTRNREESVAQTERSKYNVTKDCADRTYDGVVFDSAVEMKFYRDVVVPLVQNETIVKCERQKRYTLQPGYTHNGKKVLPIEYKADFYIVDSSGKETVVDIKGFPDSVALLKRKMFWYVYPDIDYVWVVFSRVDGGWCTYESVLAARRQRRKQKQKKRENKENDVD